MGLFVWGDGILLVQVFIFHTNLLRTKFQPGYVGKVGRGVYLLREDMNEGLYQIEVNNTMIDN